MSFVSVPPYVIADDGGARRIRIPVCTPGALVFVDSYARGSFIVKGSERAGVAVAIQVARAYVARNREALERLYTLLDAA